MAEIILVTGGARSGKSAFAQARAETLSSDRVYVATSPVTDREMAERIARHQRERGKGWRTVEETLHLDRVLYGCAGAGVVLVDCLTLWVNNLLLEDGELGEDRAAELAVGVVRAAARTAGPVLMVTNEVGWGIVPDNPLARRYRDLVGRVNQTVAAAAAEVFLVVAGQPLRIK